MASGAWQHPIVDLRVRWNSIVASCEVEDWLFFVRGGGWMFPPSVAIPSYLSFGPMFMRVMPSDGDMIALLLNKPLPTT